MSKNYTNASQASEIVKYISDTMKFPVMGAGGGFAPIGTINSYMGTVAPQGWLACDGTVYNIADYPDLATHIASHFGSTNFFGGDGTTTFGVPDLRGEFIRGAGTNSHTNQGSGANVGVHQDGTEIPDFVFNTSGNLNASGTAGASISNADVEYDKFPSAKRAYSALGTAGSTGTWLTTRPTNTSVLFIIKATVSGDANGHVYSSSEHIYGHDEDTGEIVYERTFDNLNVSVSTQWVNVLEISGILQVYECLIYTKFSSRLCLCGGYEVQARDGYLQVEFNNSAYARDINKIIVRYTKTQS